MKPRGSPIPASILVLASVLILGSTIPRAEETPPHEPPASSTRAEVTVVCVSQPGERQHCAADTSAGIALLQSTGSAPCLLGKTWGYDDQGVWVSDGCSAEFVVGKKLSETAEKTQTKQKSPEYVPNQGFRLYEGEKGQIYLRLYTYVCYLNQMGLDPTYTDFNGTVHDVQQRQDIQLTKVLYLIPPSTLDITHRS